MAQFARPAAMLYEIVRHALCWLATRPTIELHFALVCLIYTWLEWVWTRNGSKILYYLSYVFRDTSKPENPKLENLNRLLRSPLSIKLLYMYCISLYCIVLYTNWTHSSRIKIQGNASFVTTGQLDHFVNKWQAPVLPNRERVTSDPTGLVISFQERVSLAGNSSLFGRTDAFHLRTSWYPGGQNNNFIQLFPCFCNPWPATGVTAAMLVYRTIAKSLLVIWLYCYAKRERHFAIDLHTNMSASSRECNPRIACICKCN